MAILTKEELNARKASWVFISINKDVGLCVNKINPKTQKSVPEAIPAFEGYFMGIGSHKYQHGSKEVEKFDIYLKDTNNPLTIFKFNMGINTTYAWSILNKLLSVKEELVIGEHWLISCSDTPTNEFWNIFIEKSGTQLKQKFSRDRDSDKLGFKTDGNEDERKLHNAEMRKKHIAKWFPALLENVPFDKNSIGHTTPIVGESELPDTTDILDDNSDSEDCPF